MRYTILLFFLLPLFTQAQKAYIRHYKSATATDTVFSAASGLVKVTINLIAINGVQYAAIPGRDTEDPMTNEIFTPYTLANGWVALVRRFCNLELMSVTVDEGVKVETYYTR